MKQSLRERLLSLLNKYEERIKTLNENIKFFKERDDFENAFKCDIRRSTFQLIVDDLKRELND